MKDNWELSFGVFPGILFGMRTYQEDHKNNHVLYFGFVDVCLTVFKN